jgi:hypothetical protein
MLNARRVVWRSRPRSFAAPAAAPIDRQYRLGYLAFNFDAYLIGEH